MHNYNVIQAHWHNTLGCPCSSSDSYMLFTKWYLSDYWSLTNWTIVWLCYKIKIRFSLNLSMHNYKVAPVRVIIAKKLNSCMTSLRGKYEVLVKYENSMHNCNATLVHWDHILVCQCSSFGSYAVYKVVPVKQPKDCQTKCPLREY